MRRAFALVILVVAGGPVGQGVAATTQDTFPRSASGPESTPGGVPESELRVAAVLPQDGDARYELAFWESIKDSEEPADYEAYLKVFPDGRFAPLARARAKYLRERKERERETEPKTVQIEEMVANYVTVRDSNLREQPSARSRRLGVVNQGTKVLVTGRVVDENWYRVVTPDGKAGFLFGSLIQPAAPEPKPAASAPQPKRSAETPKKTPPRSTAAAEFETFKDCDACPEMVALPAGNFIMGSNRSHHTERPEHRVTISKPFAIGTREVTVGQWNACVSAGGCTFRPENDGATDSHPVHNISWSDARQYVEWLSSVTGERYRLPTEAEWEYAARARTRTPYWWGNRVGTGNADCRNCGGQWDSKTPSKAGSFAPNPFGLYDTSGGVWEWVSDCWHRSYDGAPRDGSSWEEANCRQRVLRGGSWRNDASYMVSTTRFNYDADVRFLAHGLRVAKTLRR